ncbi:MAG: hypothetical protein IKG26_09045 [Bacillus sp. (in: Bacteria)]|nr:hypothetical protein [Bacillus sp. (in: firmicutes)]
MQFTIDKYNYVQGLLDSYGFEQRENINPNKHWYSFAGKFAKLTDAEVESLEFFLYDLYGEHLHLTSYKEMDMQDVADEINEIGQEAFIKKYGVK